ncbi:hypothetical protein NT95_04220 [Oenococcus kitaharae]|nr:hypothetical protein NT95_04220 [Oenococcus kitaharae]OEY85145.1 hypothetical protein NT96_00660 [Oenococcus kitaharae]OEY86000.1 hypothetical protein NV75_00610 [Oenococcus kitaharae]
MIDIYKLLAFYVLDTDKYILVYIIYIIQSYIKVTKRRTAWLAIPINQLNKKRPEAFSEKL